MDEFAHEEVVGGHVVGAQMRLVRREPGNRLVFCLTGPDDVFDSRCSAIIVGWAEASQLEVGRDYVMTFQEVAPLPTAPDYPPEEL